MSRDKRLHNLKGNRPSGKEAKGRAHHLRPLHPPGDASWHFAKPLIDAESLVMPEVKRIIRWHIISVLSTLRGTLLGISLSL